MFKFDSFCSRSKLTLRIMLISVVKVYLQYTAWSWHNFKRTSYSEETEEKSNFQQGQKNFLFTKVSKLAGGPTKTSYYMAKEKHCLWGKAAGAWSWPLTYTSCQGWKWVKCTPSSLACTGLLYCYITRSVKL
jgi:hypothetical protein